MPVPAGEVIASLMSIKQYGLIMFPWRPVPAFALRDFSLTPPYRGMSSSTLRHEVFARNAGSRFAAGRIKNLYSTSLYVFTPLA